MTTTLADLIRAEAMLKEQYLNELEDLERKIKRERQSVQSGARMSDHFAFNTGGTASEMQGMAQRLQLLSDLIHFNKE